MAEETDAPPLFDSVISYLVAVMAFALSFGPNIYTIVLVYRLFESVPPKYTLILFGPYLFVLMLIAFGIPLAISLISGAVVDTLITKVRQYNV